MRRQVDRAQWPHGAGLQGLVGLNGENDKVITSLDISGVVLVAIQGLNEVVEEQKTIITVQAAKLADVDARLARIESEAARNRLQSAGIGAAIALPLIFGFLCDPPSQPEGLNSSPRRRT